MKKCFIGYCASTVLTTLATHCHARHITSCIYDHLLHRHPCFISSATYSRIPPKMNLKRIVTSSHSPLSFSPLILPSHSPLSFSPTFRLGFRSRNIVPNHFNGFKNDPHTKGDLTCLLTHLQKINYFNADHTHALIDLPTRYSIEEVIKLFKGGSSYWINHSRLIKGRFAWALATEHFQFRILMLDASLAILPIKRNIIASGLIRRSTRCLLSGMAWNGELRETIEMVAVNPWCR